MLDFQQKRKMRSLAYHKVTVVILGLLALLVLRSVWVVYNKQKESQELLIIAENKVKELEARDSVLKAKIANIKSERGLEEEIRAKFNVAKVGENVVIMTEEPSTTTAKVNLSLWQKIVGFFSDK